MACVAFDVMGATTTTAAVMATSILWARKCRNNRCCCGPRNYASDVRPADPLAAGVGSQVRPLLQELCSALLLVPAPSETCWFRGMSVGGSFRRV